MLIKNCKLQNILDIDTKTIKLQISIMVYLYGFAVKPSALYLHDVYIIC